MQLEKWLRRVGPSVPVLPAVDETERLASYPPPYPNGWYALCEADELKPGETRFVEALGQKLALFRTRAGTLGLLDAYCPHLGANLAGGTVRDGCLRCPFHQWSFAPDGAVAKVPYLDEVPAKLRTRAWPVREYYGQIVMWFSADAKARATALRRAITPTWQLDNISDIDELGMVYRGHHDAGVVNMHLCEFAENSADIQHFAPLHGDMFVPWTRLKLPVLGVRHVASWERDPEKSHVAYFKNDAILTAFGKAIPNSGASATIVFHGPGSLVTFHFDRPEVGRLVMFQTHLPVSPLKQRIRFRWYSEPRLPRLLASYVVGMWVSQWREDIAIWENKVFNRKPMLVPGDGPMHEQRRWFQQFYPSPPAPSARSAAGQSSASPSLARQVAG